MDEFRYQAQLAQLFERRRTDRRRTLDGVYSALAALGHPEQKQPCIQIVGTNGKGSTAAMLEATLRASGLRTGLFTSPHLRHFRERFRIDGVEVSDACLAPFLDEVLSKTASLSLPFFDVATVLALHLFAQEQVDIVLLEAGMGGRLDATTAAPSILTVFTTVGHDHQRWLGKDLYAITLDKIGAFRPNVPVISGVIQPALRTVIETAALDKGCAWLWQIGRDFSLQDHPNDGLYFRLHPTPYEQNKSLPLREGQSVQEEGQSVQENVVHVNETKTPIAKSPAGLFKHNSLMLKHDAWGPLRPSLYGRYQRHNLALAAAAFCAWSALQAQPPSPKALDTGIQNTRWPGRMQRIERDGRVFWLDGAHNPEGILALCESLPTGPYRLVFGCAQDKPLEALLLPLLDRCRGVYGAAFADPRAQSPETLKTLLQEIPDPPPLQTFPNVATALQTAIQDTTADEYLLVTGSLFLVAEALQLLENSQV